MLHIEATSFLYTHNTFMITNQRGLSPFLYFSTSIIPWRLTTICDLHIHLQVETFQPLAGVFRNYLPAFNREWEKTWHVIATQMTGLQSIVVRLDRAYKPWLRLALEEEWVSAMLLVKEVGKVKLRLFHLFKRGWNDVYVE